MAIPTSKPITLSTVQGEYGGSNPISMSEYRGKGNAPASGQIDLWADFNGTSNVVTYNQIMYADTYTRFSDSFDYTSTYVPAISNQSTATGITTGESSPLNTNETYAYNAALSTAIGVAGNIGTVRTCTVYILGSEVEGINTTSYVRGRPLSDAATQISGAEINTAGGASGSGKQDSYDLLALASLADVKDFIAGGGLSILGWVKGSDASQPTMNGYWVDLDFDYTP